MADEPSTRPVEHRVADARPAQTDVEGRRLKASVLEGLFGDADPVSVGRFRILERAGEGGFGVVYAAYDPQLDRKVALKLMRSGAKGSSQDGSDGAARLLREAKAMAQLRHPNVVAVHDAGQIGRDVYIAMELVDGQTLGQWLREEPSRPAGEVLRVLVAAGRGLAAAHRQGVVHRDFKPANVLVDREGEPRVTDFGLARRRGVPEAPAREAADRVGSSDDAVTRTGLVIGTPAYMAPEQRAGDDASERSDQFSFCVAAYEALWRQRPFAGDTAEDLLEAKQRGDIRPPPAVAGVPARVRRAVLRGLATEPERRWPSMEALLVELEPRAPRRYVGAAALVGVTVAGVVVLGRGGEATQCELASDFDGVWDGPRQAEIRGAFERVAPGLVEQTWPRVVDRADDWTAQWVASRTAACDPEATLAPAHRVLRQRCLRRARARLESQLDVLADADALAVERSVAALGELPEPDACARTDALQATPTPADAALAATVAEIRDELATVESRLQLGRPTAALAEVEALIEREHADDYAPLSAELQAVRAQCLVDGGRYEEGAEQYRSAQMLALEASHDRLALESASALTYVLSEHLDRGDEALVWADQARALAARTRAPPRLRASIRSNDAVALASLGRLSEAIEAQQRAVDLQREHPDAGEEALAQQLHNLGIYHFRLGDLASAARHVEEGLALTRRTLGDTHPAVALGLTALANVALRRRDHDQAEALYRESLTVLRQSLGEDHPDYAKTLANRGILRRRRGDLDGAREDLTRGVAVLSQTYGELSPATIKLRNGLALVELNAGKPDQAHAMLEALVQQAAGKLPPEDTRLGAVLINLGLASRRLGRLDEARRHYERGLALVERISVRHPHIGDALLALAELDLAAGERDAARQRAERAVAVFREQPGAKLSHARARLVGAQALDDAAVALAEAQEVEAELDAGLEEEDEDEATELRAQIEAVRAQHRGTVEPRNP